MKLCTVEIRYITKIIAGEQRVEKNTKKKENIKKRLQFMQIPMIIGILEVLTVDVYYYVIVLNVD